MAEPPVAGLECICCGEEPCSEMGYQAKNSRWVHLPWAAYTKYYKRKHNLFNDSSTVCHTLQWPKSQLSGFVLHNSRYSSAGLMFATLFLLCCCTNFCSSESRTVRWTNQWAVKVSGGPDVANSVAARHGYVNQGEILPGFYMFNQPRLRKRAIRHARRLQHSLSREPNVQWLQQQQSRRRVKRDIQVPITLMTKGPNDPKWSEMWYLNRGGGLDMNVQSAWDQGYTGKGVVVTILDDGLEFNHPDIKDNYDPAASYDINDGDLDPSPRYDMTNENRHGTRCAGEVAAHYNNSVCVPGIAYNAKIGGIRMLDGDVTDAVEARALRYKRDHIDIYSASWGPDDDGKTVDGPARLASMAFQDGVDKGRGGKGSIFIWASGNGGRDADSCNCDGYTNSIYTLSISSASEHGHVPWYSEACSSTLATTYSSGSSGERMIVTTDLHHGCTEAHTGTSASAPIAAAITALTLEANPNLTWRDMQHIVVRTARQGNLQAGDWIKNGAGRNVSHNFGYGLMDAGAMVRLARNWSTVAPQKRCAITFSDRNRSIAPRTRLQVLLMTDGCALFPDNYVAFLEHVQSKITLMAPRRGDIQIFLTSPMGTKSVLLAKRARDTSRAGFRDWAFMTSHSWGEKAAGQWMLEIHNDGWSPATLQRWDLILYGTDVSIGSFGGVSESANYYFISGGSARSLQPGIAFCCSIFQLLLLCCVCFCQTMW